MGNSNHQHPPQKQMDLQDQLLELKMTSKMFERESTKTLKEKEKNMQKARSALAKGDEEGSKLYLQAVDRQQKESINLLKMAHKLEAVGSQLKQNQNNMEYAAQLTKLTPFLNEQSRNLPIEDIYKNMSQFEKALDNILVTSKLIQNAVNVDQDTETTEQMFEQLKQEHRNQINAEMNLQHNAFQDIKNQYQNQNQLQNKQNQNQQMN